MAGTSFTKEEICKIFEITGAEFETIKDDPDEIKRRYRKLAKKLHPDTKPEETKEIYNKKFILLGQAYDAFLNFKESDTQNYSSYTAGYDYTYHRTGYYNYSTQQNNTEEQTYEEYTYEEPYTEQTYTEFAGTYRTGWNKFWWLLLWPLRGILYGLGMLFLYLIVFASAITTIAAFVWVPYSIYQIYHNAVDLKRLLLYVSSYIVAVVGIAVFYLLEGKTEDIEILFWRWWRL